MKTVPLETGEKVYNLRMTINNMIEFQKKLRKDTSEFEMLRLIVHYLLKWENEKLTLEKTGEIMDKVIEHKGFEYLTQQAEAAQKLFLGEKLYRKIVEQAQK